MRLMQRLIAVLTVLLAVCAPASAQLTLDYIAVQKALGLGWTDAPPEKDPPLRVTSWGQK